MLYKSVNGNTDKNRLQLIMSFKPITSNNFTVGQASRVRRKKKFHRCINYSGYNMETEKKMLPNNFFN